MGLVQLRLKVTYVIILKLRLQRRYPSINCWVKVIEWSFANVMLIVIKCFQFEIEDEYQIQYLNPFTLRVAKKRPDNVGNILLTNIFLKNIRSRNGDQIDAIHQLSFKYFVNFRFIVKLLSKNMRVADYTF